MNLTSLFEMHHRGFDCSQLLVRAHVFLNVICANHRYAFDVLYQRPNLKIWKSAKPFSDQRPNLKIWKTLFWPFLLGYRKNVVVHSFYQCSHKTRYFSLSLNSIALCLLLNYKKGASRESMQGEWVVQNAPTRWNSAIPIQRSVSFQKIRGFSF